jgi:4-hydroxybenzoate polyprenyltransferase
MLALNLFSRITNPIRAGHWWQYKASHILGFTYFYLYISNWNFKDSISIIFFAITIIGIAGLGYVINDLYDILPDKLAGKRNRIGEMAVWQRILLIVILIVIALLPWIWLKSNVWIWSLMGVEMILFFIYAHPLTRLKEKPFWGPICDALYGHAVPVIMACLTYQAYLSEIPYSQIPFFITLFAWQFAKGLRNIFLHQLEDYQNDIVAQLSTHTTIKGESSIINLIYRALLPLEILSCLSFLLIVIQEMPYWIISIPIVLLMYVLGHGLFRNTVVSKERLSSNTYLYFLNDWYEDYFPWIGLLCITLNTPYQFWLLVMHFIFFPNSVFKILKDFWKFLNELWVQIKNLIYPFYLFIRNR